MNRITKTRIEKQRENKRQGKTFGIKIKDFAKMFKRKEIQAPTPSGVKSAATGATATKPKAEAPKTKPQATGGNVTGGNRAGSPGSTKNPITPITPKAEKAPTTTKEQRVGGRVKASSSGGANAQQQRIKDEISSLKIKIKNAKTGKQKNKLQKRLETLQAKLK